MHAKPLTLVLVALLMASVAVITSAGEATQTAAEVLKIKWVNPPENAPEGVRHATFQSKAVRAEVGYNIYLPEAYAQEPERRFPVIYFLHGSAGHESRSIHVAGSLHQAIAASQVQPLVMVFPNGGHNSAYLDSVDGTVKVETMIMAELIPHIDATYRTVAARHGRGIEGFSMGGAGALRFALKHPEQFASVVVYGAGGMNPLETMPTTDDIRSQGNKQRKLDTRTAMSGTDLEHWRKSNSYYLAEENLLRIRGHLPIRMVIGTGDYSLEGAHVTQNRLDELKIPHEYELIGRLKHNIRDLYEQAGVRGLQFHERAFRAAASAK
jgi:S-formylglutathione hydrolase FrmB